MRARLNSRGVSQIVASMILIALVIAGGSVAAVVLNNSVNNDSTVTSDDQSISLTETVSTVDADLVIAKLTTKDGEDFYRSIDLQIKFNGPTTGLYVFDVDIILDGTRLDDISEWEIVDWGSATYTTDSNNAFSGYYQSKGSTVTYKVNLTDSSKIFARVLKTDGFVYEVKVGTQKGKITDVLSNVQYATTVFNAVFYNVTTIHYAQNPASTNSAINMIETQLTQLNGSNKIYFRYDPALDRYDSSTPTNVNMTRILNRTEILITAEWGINSDLATNYQTFKNNSIGMLFFGSISSLVAVGKFDNATTFALTGMGLHTFNAAAEGVPANYKTDTNIIFDGEYKYNVSKSPMVSGLSGTIDVNGSKDSVDEIPVINATNPLLKPYGSIKYVLAQFQSSFWGFFPVPVPIYEFTTSMYVLQDKSFGFNNTLIKEIISIGGDPNLYSTSDLTFMIRDSILTLTGEIDRLNKQAGINLLEHGMTEWGDAWSVGFFQFRNTFTQKIAFQVNYATIEQSNVSLKYVFPENYDFTYQNYTVALKVGSGQPITRSVALQSDGTNPYTMSFSLQYFTTQDLPENTTVQLYFIDIIVDPWPAGFSIVYCDFWDVTLGYQRGNGELASVYDDITQSVPYTTGGSPYCGYDQGYVTITDINPPAQVTGLALFGITASQITLDWNDNTEPDLSGYNVYRNGTLIASPTASTFTDTGLSPTTTYSYVVTAVDTSGNIGPNSTTAVGTTYDAIPPGQVTGLVATPMSNSRIDLVWTANTEPDLNYYNIYRNGTLIATSATDSYAAVGLARNSFYSFIVSAVDLGLNEGLNSTTVVAKTLDITDTTPPAQVNGVTQTSATLYSVAISWTAVPDLDLSYYNIYFSNGTLIGTSITTTYNITNLAYSTSYSIQVSAVDTAANEGLKSSAANINTNDPKMYILSISLTSTASWFGRINVIVTITVQDQFNQPVSGAIITYDFNQRGSVSSQSGTTDATGTLMQTYSFVRTGFYSVTITNVSATNYTYDPTMNVTSYQEQTF